MTWSEIGTPDQSQDVSVQVSQDVALLRSSAQDALSRNFAILAVEPNSKKPLSKYSPNGVKSASTDPKIALRPYDEGVPANYGVACEKSNLAVIDVDKGVSSLEGLKLWMQRNSLHETLTVVSGRQGFGAHLYYSGAVPSTTFDLEGVSGEVKSIGAYVVGAGSVHPSGKKYEIADNAPVAKFPTEVFKGKEKLRAKPAIVSAVVPEGQRNRWETSLAGYLRNFKGGALSDDAIYEGLKALSSVCCEDGEAYVAANDAKIRDLAKRGVRNFEVSPEFRLKRMSHAEMIAEAERDSNFVPIVKDLIFRKTVNIGIGDSGLGKTPFIVQLALCVAFGLPFIGQECQRGKVLIADYENHIGLVELLTAVAGHLGIQTPIDKNWLTIICNADRGTLAREIEEFRPDLVIVDSLRGYDSSAEGDSKSAADMIANCQEITERNDCAWIFIHNLRKQNKSLKADERPDLFNTDVPVTDWLQEGAGFLGLINQSFSRIGFAKPKKDQNSELGLRTFVKGRGEVGPWFINREYDDSGEPIGYKRLQGADLLSETDRELLFRLPVNESINFTKLLDILVEGNMSRKPFVAKFLLRCVDAGVIKTSGKDRTPSKAYMRMEAA
jgi:hypothetical protein